MSLQPLSAARSTRAPLGPVRESHARGAALRPSPGRPLGGQSPWLLQVPHSPDALLYFLEFVFRKSNGFLCFPNRNAHTGFGYVFQIPAGPRGGPCGGGFSPALLVPPSELLTSAALPACHSPPSPLTASARRVHLQGRARSKELTVEKRRQGAENGAHRYIGFYCIGCIVSKVGWLVGWWNSRIPFIKCSITGTPVC